MLLAGLSLPRCANIVMAEILERHEKVQSFVNLNLDGIHPSYTTFASIPLNNTNDSELFDLDDSQPSDLDLGNDFVQWIESWFQDVS